MQTSRTKASACECGHVVDHATSAFGDHVPRPGDPTVCIRCGRVNVFDAELGVKPLPRRDVRRLDYDVRQEITRAQNAVKRVNDLN